MIDYLINKFVDLNNREKACSISSYIGITCNIFLCILKIVTGFIINSISVITDGVNNLTDCISAIVTLVAFKLSSHPADKQHPFGHGRYEYISGLFVSIIIIIVGIAFLQTSIGRIINPSPVHASVISIILLVVSILVKVLMYLFNNRLGTLIKSETVKAMAKDSLSDTLVTSITILSLITTKFTILPIDGIVGLIVSVIIIYTGIKIIIEEINILLGKPVDNELKEKIKDIVCSHNEILGMHDLMVHDYGPGKMIASLHTEIDASKDIMSSHEIIDSIEKELYEKLHIITTIHLDPVDLNNKDIKGYNELIKNILNEIDLDLNFHDLRVVAGPNHSNVVFDVVLSEKYMNQRKKLTGLINEKVHKTKPNIDCVITYDVEY